MKENLLLILLIVGAIMALPFMVAFIWYFCYLAAEVLVKVL